VADGNLQEGIYYGSTDTPPGFFSLVLLSAAPGAAAKDVADLLESLWACYQELKEGRIGDLKGVRRMPAAKLQVLLGLGAPAFDLQRPKNAPARPLAMLQSFEQPVPGSGGPISENSGISYERDVSANPADAAIALQFTAETALAVEQAVVETWKVLEDAAPAALAIQAVYTGSKRGDRRSWIDFYDGPSNLAQDERLPVIAIPPNAHPDGSWEQDAWTEGGTYLAFIRLYIDLRPWRALPVAKQEELVGRTKLRGLPLKSLPPPVRSSTFRDPGDKGHPPHEADAARLPAETHLDPALSMSHIQRANHHNPYPGGVAEPMNHRIFRQGYPFLEPLDAPPGFRVGLNFISFQSTPASLTGMLKQAGWLGNTNFGGDTDPATAVVLLSARAAGFFLVPPVDGTERFPGEHVLTGPPKA